MRSYYKRIRILVSGLLFLFTIAMPVGSFAYDLMVSSSPDRSGAVFLDGETVEGNIYVFVTPESGISQVRFFMDDPLMNGLPAKVESFAPYDLGGTDSSMLAIAFNSAQLVDGSHTLTALSALGDGSSQVIAAGFTVANDVPGMVFSKLVLNVTIAEGGGTTSQTIDLGTSDGGAVTYTISDDAAWLGVSPTSGVTPDALTVTIDATGLVSGIYTASITATADGYVGDAVDVTLFVTGGSGAYQQNTGADGIVSIEVENYDVNASQGGHDWVPVFPAGFSGSGAMQAQPNTGANTNAGYVSNSPRLDYAVNFVSTGIHYVWIRGMGATNADDSVHVGLDGVGLATSDRISTFNPTWTWSKATMDAAVATVNVATPGVHTVNVWMREDGFIVDKLVLTVNAGYTPIGEGPAESLRGDSLVFTPDTLTFSVEEGGTTASQVTNLVASDGGAVTYTISDDAAWLTVLPTSGVTPGSLDVSTDATGLVSGIYTASITATADGYVGDAVDVTLFVTGGSGAYQQNTGADGIVSIEVENYDVNASQGGHDWVPVFPAGFSGSGAMQAQPNTGANTNAGYVSNSPRLDYAVNFVSTGIHYVWIRGMGATNADDSVHVGLDGVGLATSDRISTFNPTWTWSKATMDAAVATVNVATPGVHTVNVWMREDGFVMDKLVLTVNAGYTPIGEGPAESLRGDSLVFTPDALTFSVEEGGTTASQVTNLVASDGGAVTYTISDDAAWLTVLPTSGVTPGSLDVSTDATGLVAGIYTAAITATAGGYLADAVSVTLTVTGVGSLYDLMVSSSPDRSGAVFLDGETVEGNIYVFVTPESGISQVRFFIDDPQMNGLPDKVESFPPYDLGGGNGSLALPFDSSQLADGQHEMTALVMLSDGGSEIRNALFSTNNSISLPFADDFQDADADGWSIIDDSGNISNWIIDNGEYRQSDFIGNSGSALQGSYHLGAYSILQKGQRLTDYRFSADVTPQIGADVDQNNQGNDIGVMFRYLDNDNYYRFSMNANKGFSRLEKKFGGIFSTLAKDARGYQAGEQRNILIEVVGPIIQVYLDGDPLFSAFDPAISSGSVGLYVQDDSKFDNVRIEEISNSPSIIISTPSAYSVSATENILISAVVTNPPASGNVEFRIDGFPCEEATESPEGLFQSECFNLSQGEHVLDGVLLDGTTQVSSDTNISIGVQGNDIVSIGDSITNGVGDKYPFDNVSMDGRIISTQGYQAVLSDLLTETLSVPTIIFNEGIPGDESVDVLDLRLASIISRNGGADKALVLLGTNDSGGIGVPSGSGCSGSSCNGTFKGNIQSLIESLNTAGISAYVAKIPPAWGSGISSDTMYPDPMIGPRNLVIQEYNRVIESELVGANPGPDFFDAFLTSSTHLISLYDDMFHPNSLGYVVMANLWHDALDSAHPLGVPFILNNLQANTVAAYLQQNLLAAGSRYYVDENFTLTQVPEILNQGRWIMTANADSADASANYLSFSVARSVTVYIAIDANAPDTPAWLNQFDQTGLEIRVDSPASGSFNLYSRSYPAGAIVLGGNRQGVSAANIENYVVIVVDNEV